VLIRAGLFGHATLQTYVPWITVDALAALPGWVQLVILFAITDFCVYSYHRAQHSNIVLWQFNKTHQSKKELTALTAFWMPIVVRLVTLAALAVPAAALGVSYAQPLAVLVALYFHQLLVHSATGWGFSRLACLVFSPRFHEIHHSSRPEHLNRNYGSVLSIWDRLFGTRAPQVEAPARWVLVDEPVPGSFIGQIFVPVVGLYQLARHATFSAVEPAKGQRR
jgi:sterol desaturase/sphingolipid hydroxylase (fatty acid hydroxylase superfamily)